MRWPRAYGPPVGDWGPAHEVDPALEDLLAGLGFPGARRREISARSLVAAAPPLVSSVQTPRPAISEPRKPESIGGPDQEAGVSTLPGDDTRFFWTSARAASLEL